VSAYSPEISLQSDQLTGQELLTCMYDASRWFDILKPNEHENMLSNDTRIALQQELCEEISSLFDKISSGVYHVTGYPSHISYIDSLSQTFDLPYKVPRKLSKDAPRIEQPVVIELGELLGIRENPDGKLSVEIAYPSADFSFEGGRALAHAYVVPLTGIMEVVEIAYFDNHNLVLEEN
jgi:hypothetical protein